MIPQNLELEKTVLGKLLNLEKFEIQSKYCDLMQEDFFFTQQNKDIFNAIKSCIEQNTLAYPHYLIEKKLVDDESLVDILTYRFESNQKMTYSYVSPSKLMLGCYADGDRRNNQTSKSIY